MKDPFAVTDQEYNKLMELYSDLSYYASWQLMRKNTKNNHTEDIDDINQQLNMAIIRAGRYYKRQVYIESCLKKVEEYAKNKFVKGVIQELKYLWANKTKHGANKKKFGDLQESILEELVKKYVPTKQRPDINAPLLMDKKFIPYSKSIVWNQQKSMGKKITKERAIRNAQVSLSEFSHMGAEL